MSCARARRATSAPPACSPGSSRRRSRSPTAAATRASSPCRTTTTSSTARRSGRCSRSAAPRGSAIIPWSPLARGLLAGKRRAGQAGDTTRAKTDAYSRQLYEDADLVVADRVVETARQQGVPAGANRARLAPLPPRRHRPDRRRHPDRAPGRRRRLSGNLPLGRGDPLPRRALPPPPGARAHLTGFPSHCTRKGPSSPRVHAGSEAVRTHRSRSVTVVLIERLQRVREHEAADLLPVRDPVLDGGAEVNARVDAGLAVFRGRLGKARERPRQARQTGRRSWS